jgi:membrane associated rhomboid family serine protease
MLRGDPLAEQERADRADARQQRRHRLIATNALSCGLGCWVFGLLFHSAWLGVITGATGVVLGAMGLAIPERRGQSIAGFVLSVIYCFLVLLGVSLVFSLQRS